MTYWQSGSSKSSDKVTSCFCAYFCPPLSPTPVPPAASTFFPTNLQGNDKCILYVSRNLAEISSTWILGFQSGVHRDIVLQMTDDCFSPVWTINCPLFNRKPRLWLLSCMRTTFFLFVLWWCSMTTLYSSLATAVEAVVVSRVKRVRKLVSLLLKRIIFAVQWLHR